ncbi:MAG TPA: alpha/beta hydrolase, partial [Puia sp.]|nr:alpha/beta hydrolase [Puia sp.]
MYKQLIALTMALTLLILPRMVRAQSSYSFSVQKTGQGPAMILIPGLYCSGDVWAETVAHYKEHYTCYSLTLPGFAGQPSIHPDSLLPTIAGEIARFIQENQLQKPLLVGHSLGGWLVLEVAIQQPQLVGGIVCVSSAPFLPGLSMGNQVSLDSTRAIGATIKKYMVVQTPEQIRQSQQYMLGTMIRDSAHIREVTEMAMRSDPATQGEVMYELFSMDLRPEMHKLRCPVLVLGDWIAYKTYGATRENVMEKYQQQFAAAGKVSIAISD